VQAKYLEGGRGGLMRLEAAQAEGFLEEEGEPEDGGGEEEGVDAVEDAAVAGEHGAGVFDAGAALDGGLEQVAELGGDVEDGGEGEGLPDGLGDVDEGVAVGGELVGDDGEDSGCDEGGEDGGGGAFPGLAGGEVGGELMAAEGSADVEGGGVAGPDGEHEQEDEGEAVFALPEEGDEGEGVGDPN